MAKIAIKSMNSPDDTKNIEKGKVQLVSFDGTTIGRAIFQPGWRWSKHLKPKVKTDSCKSQHLFYHVSGTMKFKMDDGTEKECRAGDVSYISPGHDAWVVGKEPVVVVDFRRMANVIK